MFKAVPFAKPPVGNLRFALPENPEPWEGIKNASVYSPACLSIKKTHSRYPQQAVSEDCLYINIFTSEHCFKKPCAVIVYYHGGSYNMESAVMFPDDFILERYVADDVVFAIPAFRLGALGQMYFGPNGTLTENLFMYDAVQALKFVHEEINSFGGDPSRVTIMGHSTGAFMVNSLGFSKLIDPGAILFQQMIVLSAPGEFGFYEQAVKSSIELAGRLNCTINGQSISTLHFSEILECLRQVDALKLLDIQTEMIEENRLNFRSVIRGTPMMKLGEKIADFKKDPPRRNILYGTTEFEFFKYNKWLGPHAAGSFLDFENPMDVVLHYYDLFPAHDGLRWPDLDSDGIFISARTYCEAMANVGGNVYLFETRQDPLSLHITDMQYFIGIHRELVHTSDMDKLDKFYSKLLVNFTKTGVPSPEWGKLDPRRMNYLELKVDSVHREGPLMKENYHEKTMGFWFGDMMDYDRSVTFYKNFSVFKQWWFYLVLFLVFALIVFGLVRFRRRKTNSGETIPLLSQ